MIAPCGLLRGSIFNVLSQLATVHIFNESILFVLYAD